MWDKFSKMKQTGLEFYGIGLDIVSIPRFHQAICRRPSLVNRLFNVQEQAYASRHRHQSPIYAKRFAAKEATLKALGTGPGKFCSWKDIFVENHEKGAPGLFFSPDFQKRLYLHLYGEALSTKHEPWYRLELSLTDEKDLAQAVVLIFFKPPTFNHAKDCE